MTCFLRSFTCTSFSNTFTFIGRNFSLGIVTNFSFGDDKVLSNKLNLSKSAKIEKKIPCQSFSFGWPIEVHFLRKDLGKKLNSALKTSKNQNSATYNFFEIFSAFTFQFS